MKQNGKNWPRFLAAVLLAAMLGALLPTLLSPVHAGGSPARQSSQALTLTRDVPGAHGFVRHKTDGGTACREATTDETSRMKQRRSADRMRVITDTRSKQAVSAEAAGLQITLRGTAQLDDFPTAKAAFLNAAAAWESVISTPISIVIDVDFGPTWFGEAYDKDVLGQTDSQDVGDSNAYAEVRSSLISNALNSESISLFNLLPSASLPTDIGNTTYVVAPTAAWRSLGLIGSVADPASEQQTLGDPPAIGFNSAFDYDFDPSNGIGANLVDFDAVATHEIGHALGFTSNTGYNELNRRAAVAVTIWDMFRFRPGTSLDTFASATRILSSGGQQDFFGGSEDLALSTGRPDGSGGDHEQSSHWKDDRLSGQYIGIMDPTIGDGERQEITANDLTALRAFGYQVTGEPTSSNAPVISDASFNGKKLKITGKRFSGAIDIQINGQSIATALNVKVNSSSKKIQVKASAAELNLNTGTNQIVVIGSGGQSNAFALGL